MLARAAAVLTVAAIAGAVAAGSVHTDTGAAQRYEFYPPFRMVWVEEDARGAVYTIELMWRGSRSWTTVLRASSADPGSVGRTGSWDGTTLTSDDPVTGRSTYRPELTVNASLTPAQWLQASRYLPEDGWEALEPDADGNERFRKTETRQGRERTVTRARDPDTWLVVGSTTTIDGELLNTVRVIELEVQPGSARYP
ncbi:MAG: hypothetical protein OXH97_10150 [Chloroflexota bacterium]|nr:hypothetical protein [Chloroflexota bacterium]